jgi:hypothetical protein
MRAATVPAHVDGDSEAQPRRIDDRQTNPMRFILAALVTIEHPRRHSPRILRFSGEIRLLHPYAGLTPAPLDVR